jgi:hypothetical protein
MTESQKQIIALVEPRKCPTPEQITKEKAAFQRMYFTGLLTREECQALLAGIVVGQEFEEAFPS